jgi:hypothetical protein
MNGSGLALSKIESHFMEKSQASSGIWKPIVQDALFTCEEPAACEIYNLRNFHEWQIA